MPPRRVPGLEAAWSIVTGSTRGNGRAIADALAAHGSNVIITSRNPAEAEAVAKDLEGAHGTRVLGFAADVSRLTDAERLVERTLAVSGGRLDVLVNNAGYPLVPEWWNTPLHETSPETLVEPFRSVYATDVEGARYCTRAALRPMMAQRRGAIVFVSSTPALAGFKGTPYTEAKAAVLGLMKDVAREYGPRGIRANAIAPGNVRTVWYDSLSEAEKREAAAEASLRRWGEPEEIANAVVFLASDLASFVTGQTLVVDGGTELR